MAANMRAKMQVTSVEKFTNQDTVKLSAVSATKYGPNGESEDNTFARFTPTAQVTIAIANPDLIGKFAPGDILYVDFSPVPKPVDTPPQPGHSH